MRNTSENSSRISKWIAAAALLAMAVAGITYVAPHLWNRAAKHSPVAYSARPTALSPAVPDAATARVAPTVALNPTPAAPAISKSPALTAALGQIPGVASPNPPTAAFAKKIDSAQNEVRMEPDTGSGDTGVETGEDPKLRADYFYHQRAYPFDQTPAGARQQSLQQLDTMIAQQRAAGILPEEGAAAPNSVGFPGPANWTNLGPQPVTNGLGGQNFGNPTATGRVTAIAVDPTTTTPGSQVVYVGAATGGVWKSTDGGTTWNTIFDQNNSLAIGGIATGRTLADHNTIYVGTGELNFSGDSYYGAGIYKSTDGGTNWTQQCGPSGEFCTTVSPFAFQGGGFMVGDIAVNPTNANIALAAVRDSGNSNFSGIYRTTDGGTTWTLIPSASGAVGNSIVWNPQDNTVVYATLGERGNIANFGVYKSTDSGVTFTRLTGNGVANNNLPTLNLGRHVLAVAPSNGNVVYVGINAESTSNLLGLGKSIDAGATWTFTAPSSLPSLPDYCHGQCWYDQALAVLPNDPNTLIVGGSAFTNNSSTDFRTSDGGITWVDITNGSSAVRPHVDTHAMTFAATTGGFRLYTGNDGGIWFTDNPTAAPVTWQAGNNANLTITQFYPGHAVSPSDENISFGGTQDNGTEKYSGNSAWDHVACGDGAWAAIDPVFPTLVYANCQNIQILRSNSDGAAGTFSTITNQIPTSGERSLFIPPLIQDRNQSGVLYFGTFRVWQTVNYGNNWAAISPDITSHANNSSNEVTSISVSRSNSNVVYATTTDGSVWRTTNANAGTGATWTNLTAAPLPGRYATMVRTDNSNPDIAYLSYSGFSGFNGDTAGHIFKTINGGAIWTDISGSLPNTPVNDIAVVHLGSVNFDAVFIATAIGVFECSDPTVATPCQTWTPVGTGLPRVPVVGLAFRENSATLRAITHGRGVWVIETPGISAAGLLLLTSITPSSRPPASGAFTMTFDGNDFGVSAGNPPPQILVDGADPGVTAINVISPNHMTATIPAIVTAAPGLHQISINQPGHAPQNPSNNLTFSVTVPAPILTVLTPNQVPPGNATFTMTVTGSNFLCAASPSGSVVNFGSTVLTNATCNSNSLTVSVPSNLLTNTASIPVHVFTAGPGGGLSSVQTFTVGTPSGNDNFASATVINTLPFTDSQNVGADTTEAGEPVPNSLCVRLLGAPSASTHSIWYSYTPSANGVVSFSSPGETEAGVIQVVTGNALGSLSLVAGGCSLDINSFFRVSGSAAATVKVSAGVTYHIMLSDFTGNGGTGVLQAAATPPPANDDFANAVTVSTVGFADTRTTTGATTEFGEPLPACTSAQAASTHSVWYRYTPGSSGTAIFNTTGSGIDSIIQVVTGGLGGLGGFSAVTGGCSDQFGQGAGETVTFSVTSGTTYFIMVSDWDGIGGTSVLNFMSGPAPTGGGTPDMTITKSHTGNFTQGQTGATYTITATNSGAAATTGTVTVVDTLPTGLAATALSGTGWTCTLGTLTCTRSDVLANGSSYPAITLTVTVANNAAASVTNSVTVSGGGETNTANDSATDPTTVTQVADLTIAKSHVGSFSQGQTGAAYTITASNAGPGPTSGTVTVVDTLPTGLTATAMSGTGWSCTFATGTCTRSDVLAAASSYPAITLTVNVAINATNGTNSVTVSGGGEINTANDTATDSTTVTIISPDMTITKTHTGSFTQGQVGATYTITATNSGGAATTAAVSVVDTLPTGIAATALSGTGWTCTLGSLTCTRNDVLAAAASYPAITLTVTVANNAAANVTNSVTVSGGGETNLANDTATDPTTVVQVADLTISKSHTGNFSQGQVGATYSITVSNSGPGPTSGTVTVIDTVPTGLTATAMVGTGWTCTLGTVTCTRADVLAVSTSYPAITLTVTVANNAASSVTNTATVSGGGQLNTANDVANDITTVTQASDLTITKTHTGNFTQGQVGATYTITASNAGPGPTNGTVTVVDTLPAGLTATSEAGTGWTCVLGTLTCTRTDVLAPASSYPAITLTVTVANNAAASVTNSATISGGGEINTANDTAADPTTVNQVSDLTVTKSHTGSFTQGQVGATYTITVNNGGSAATTGTVTAVDTLPTGLAGTAITGTGWTCTLGTLTCIRADALGTGLSYPAITLTVTVANNAAASVTNSVTVSGGGEFNTANDTTTDPTTVIQVADLTITKTHTGNFIQGQVGATYSITASNSGPGPTSGTVTVVDTIPTGLTATAMAGTGWTCTLGSLTCTRNDVLAAAGSYPAITLTVTVANNAAASVTNTATVSGGGELNTANDTANDVTTIALAPDLTITKTHVGNFTQGQVGATYSITVSNAGPGTTSGTVTVVDTLPTGLSATAEAGTGWTCVLGTLTCTRSDVLAAAASYPAITLTVTVANNANASVTNTAVVSGGAEINTANDSASDTTTITQVADLTITKTHVGNFTQGQIGAAYTITVTNGGAGATAGTVTVVDTLPAGLTATAEAGTGWTCVLGTLTCTRADVLAAAGSYPAITLTVTVANNAAASVTNTATVSGGGELNVANDVATNQTTITQLADMTITKTHTGNFTLGQTGATYTITATNSGTGATSGTVTVVDSLPTGLTATAMAGTGWTCTLGTLTCTRSDVLAAASSYPAITLTVTVGTTPGNVTNTATVSGGGEIIVNNDVANDVTTVLTPPTATLSVNALVFTSQGVNTTSAARTITVTNNGGATLTFTAAPAITLANASDFAISGGTTCTNGATVLGGATCIINITFTPAAAGARGPATLTLTDNASPATQTASLTGTGIDFAESGPASPVTVTAGQSATFTITLTPGTGGFANAVTFSASGLPAATTATFNPTSVTPGATAGTTVLSIATTARGAVPPSSKPKPWTPPQFVLWSFALAAILLGFILFGGNGRRRRLTPAMFVAVALLLAIGISGCSSMTGTPAGTSTITVTATSGSLVHTTTVTLTVQ